MRVAALVVAYNPELGLIERNINSYIEDVDQLFILDNSDEKSLSSQGFQGGSKVTLIDFQENKGIAYALNYGCKQAIKCGFSWILTFDQDSCIEEGYVESMKRFCRNYHSTMQTIGMLAPQIDLQLNKVNVINSSSNEVVDVVMTSGCLVNLDAYQAVKGFEDALFIDWVDNDFCYRLKLRGYKIVRLHSCVLRHCLGESIEYCFFKKHLFYATNHSPFRYYYKTRNAFYLSRVYRLTMFKVSVFLLRSVVMDCMKIVLFEKDKIRKLRFIKQGIIDYKKGRMYKLSTVS